MRVGAKVAVGFLVGGALAVAVLSNNVIVETGNCDDVAINVEVSFSEVGRHPSRNAVIGMTRITIIIL